MGASGVTGISDGEAGSNESQPQTLSVTATSSNTTLVQNPMVTLTSGNQNGTLTYTLEPDASGTATVTVTVTDNGGTVGGGFNSIQQAFIVSVSAVNQPPTLNPIGSLTILENAGLATATATLGSGATAGMVTLLSVTNGGSGYGTTAPLVTISAPAPNGGTTATATAILTNGVVTGFTITNPGSGYIATPTVTIALPPQTHHPDRHHAGPGNTNETVTMVVATSGTPGLIPNPSITYGGGSVATLSFTPIRNATGTTLITVTVTNSGSNVFPNVNTFQQQFTVNVLPVNQSPDAQSHQQHHDRREFGVADDSALPGSRSGNPSSGQTLTVTAASSNPALIPQSGDHLHQPQHHRRADLHVGTERHRHGRDHRHRDEQRRHGQRRHRQLQPELHDRRHAGQPAADARCHPEPPRHLREFLDPEHPADRHLGRSGPVGDRDDLAPRAATRP